MTSFNPMPPSQLPPRQNPLIYGGVSFANQNAQQPQSQPTAQWQPQGQPPNAPHAASKNEKIPALPTDFMRNLTPAEQDLQRRFPGTYAHLVNSMPFSQTGPNTRNTIHALNKWRHHQPLKDYELASLDNTTNRFGTIIIASLATLGLKTKLLGVPEFLGVASWYTAMAATPYVIHGVVQAKTGVNLNQLYDTSYGDRKNLFNDPHYLPLHILPETTINRVAKRFGIADNDPEKRPKTEEKMRQISVQANSWWMLVAGPATPVLAGFMGDQLRNPVLQASNALLKATRKFNASRATKDADVLSKRADAYLERLVGKVPASDLSTWWSQFNPRIVRELGLYNNKSFSRSQFLASSQENQLDLMMKHLLTLKNKPDVLNATARYLAIETKRLDTLKQTAETFLKSHQAQLAQARDGALGKQQDLILSRYMNGAATIAHYQRLIGVIKAGGNDEAIRQVLDTSLSSLKAAELAGFRDSAKRMAGAKIWSFLRSASTLGQNGFAFELMGATPRAHLLESLTEAAIRKGWQNKVLLGMGGGLGAMTALYTYFFVGHDFQQPNQKGASND